jgi:hypothetical protein
LLYQPFLRQQKSTAQIYGEGYCKLLYSHPIGWKNKIITSDEAGEFS